MPLNSSLLAGLLFWVLAAALPHPAAAEEINPPFGLRWGETTERMATLLQGARATVVERRTVAGREAWDVEGLIQPGLKRTVFYFQRGELVEVELQYQKDDWSESQYDGYLGEVRKRLEQKYGEGQLIARRTEQQPESNTTQKVVGYKWNQNNTAIELVYFAVASGARSFRTLSVHYKTF